ncbi:PAS domain S-box protein [Leptothoe spongobia TAU-MAC 1115]|uniref:histidine kinase n=2 Tax=Leptothoe TaxID=2651725 RepID=A0A947GIZ6_9CYAN|nr:ATP-binding protein [Leptothoe spongobia]MBT9315282.1 PAS domain S-box protein [Leptothoe spongobia TAU-MAC 1115]
MTQLLAAPIEQLSNRPFQAIFSTKTDHSSHYWQALNTSQTVTFEDTVTLSDRRYQFAIEAIPVPPVDNAAAQLIVTFTRRSSEAALRQSEERFRSLFEGVSLIGMQIYDHQRRVIGWNRASEQLYGYTCKEAMGQQLEDLIIPDAMREWVIQAVEAWLQRGIPIPACELTLRHKNGGPVEVFSSHMMLTNLEGEPELYCLDLDISDRKQAESTLQQAQLKMMHGEKMSSLGKMVAGIAHEINNPISFIDGNLDHAKEYMTDLLHLVSLYQTAYPSPRHDIQSVLESLDLDFIQKDFFKLATSMQVGADRIRSIVDSLRNFSRLDETGAKVVDIHDGLNSTLRILHHRLQTIDPAIQVVKNYGNLSPIVCYPGPLNQVFMNVLTNAIDALADARTNSSTGSPQTASPQIEISTSQPGGRQTVISICDNGPGISDTVKAQIFDPFFTTKPVGQGTGMGLAISYQVITQQHQGQLLVESVHGKGTCVEIRLPLASSLATPLQGPV